MALQVPYRAVFLSDIHLGSSASRADEAATFLKHVSCDTLYLVGDIIDMWRLRSRWYWPESHNRFVRRVLKMCKRGTRVVFIPGNHDDSARGYTGLSFGGIEMAREIVHTTVDGRRLLVVHGDEADLVVRHHRLLSHVGSVAYEHLVTVNRRFNQVRIAAGLQPWSLSQAIKLRVKKACQHISRFEEALAAEARRQGLDGVICGHIHKAEARAMPCGTLYYNCGDWVESGTAHVEHDDGTLRVIDAAATLRELSPAGTAGDEADEDHAVGTLLAAGGR